MRRYVGFISYSQSDKQSATQLHRWLERYRLPGDIAKSLNLDRSLGRFFRDDDEMSASPNIARQINEAIEASDNLIVVCSPKSANSAWVEAEIQQFRATGRGDRVFAIIIEGEPNADDPEIECFPPSLRRAGKVDGERLPIEPLALDLRKEGRERACARLVAGLLNLEFDALWRRQRRRFVRRAALAGLAAFLLLSVYAAILMERTRDFNGQKSEFYTQLARLESEAVQSDMDDDAGQYDRAIRLAMIATRPGLLHPKNNFARDELAKALHAIPNSLQLNPPDEEILYTMLSPGRTELAMLNVEGWISLIDLERMHVSSRFKTDITRVRAGTYHPIRHWLALDNGNGAVHLIDLDRQTSLMTTPSLGQQVSKIQFSDNGQYMLVLGSNTYVVWELATGNALDRFIDTSVTIDQDTQWIPNSERLLVAENAKEGPDETVRVRDPIDGADVVELGGEGEAFVEIAPSRDGQRLVARIRNGGFASDDYRIVVLDLDSFEEVRSISSNPGIALDFQLDESEAEVAVAHTIEGGCFGRFLDIYDLERRGAPKTIPISSGTCASKVNLEPANSVAVTSHSAGVVRVWNYRFNPASEMAKLQAHNGRGINATYYLPRQEALVTHGGDGTVIWWDLAGYDNVLRSFPFDRQPEGIHFSPSGNRILAWSSGDVSLIEGVGTVPTTNQPPSSRSLLDLPFRSSAEIRSAALVPGHDRVIVFGNTGEILRLEGPDWKISEFGRIDPIVDVEFTRDRERAAILTESSVHTIDLLEEAQPRELETSTSSPRLARFSPNRDRLAVVHASGVVKIWTLTTNELLHTIDTGALGDIAELIYSPDDKIALSGDFGFLLIDARTGRILDTASVNETFRDVGVMALAPDSAWLYLQGQPRDPNFSSSKFVARYNLKTFEYEDFLWRSSVYNEMVFLGPDRLMIEQSVSDTPLFVMSPTSFQIIAVKAGLRFNPAFDFDPMSRRAVIGDYGRVVMWDLNWATEPNVKNLRETLCSGMSLGRNELTVSEQDAQKIGLLSNLIGRNVCELNNRNSFNGYDLLGRGRTPADLLEWMGEPGRPHLSTTQAARFFLARFEFEELLRVRGAYADRAQVIAASALASGVGVTRDIDRATAMYEALAARDVPVALQNLAGLKEQASGRTEETLSLIVRAAELDFWMSHRLLGQQAVLDDDSETARSHLTKALEEGDGYSAYLIGRWLIDADQSADTPSEAACEWFEKGAAIGDPTSLLAMSRCQDFLNIAEGDVDGMVTAFLNAAIYQDREPTIRRQAQQRLDELKTNN